MHNNKVIVATTYKHIPARCNTRHFAFITSLGLYHRLSSSVFLILFYRWGNRLSIDLVFVIYSEVEQLFFQMQSGQPESMSSVFYRISGIWTAISQVNRPEASIFHISVLEFFPSFFFLFVSQENTIIVDTKMHSIPVYILKISELINILSENCSKSIFVIDKYCHIIQYCGT